MGEALALSAFLWVFSQFLCVFGLPALIVLFLLIPGEDKEAIARKTRERQFGIKQTEKDSSLEVSEEK